MKHLQKIKGIVVKLREKQAVRQLSLMLIVTLLTQAISMYKSAITAANFGACVEMDAYHFANNLATFFLTFVSTGVTTVVIPAYVKKMDRKAVDTFLTVVFGTVFILLAATFIFREPLVELLTNREAEFAYYVNNLLLLTILIQLFPAMLGVTTAYYQCIGKFNFPKIVLLISNIFTMAVYLYWEKFSIYQYLYVMLAGAAFQFAVDLLYALKCGFRFRIELDLKNEQYKSILKIFLPTLLSTGIYKINTLVDSLLSSNLGTGQLTVLSYSTLIVGMVNTLIISNFTAYVYPKIVEKMKISQKECQRAVFDYLTVFHGIVVLLIIGFVGAGREFIGILYEHGEFSAQAADSVYVCMCIYIFGQQNNIIRDLLYRFFMAHGATMETTKNGILTSCSNIVLSIVLIRFFGIYGIVIGTVAAGIISLAGILVKMKAKFGFEVNMGEYVKELVKSEAVLISGIVLMIAVKAFVSIPSDIAGFLVFGTMSVILYGAGMLCVRSKVFNAGRQ